jgi:neopullulanase
MFRALLCFVLVSVLQFQSLAQINHVEPLNWWVGMKDPKLQLLVNGADVGLTMPTISYPGVSISKVNKADSKNYLFIDLLIDKNTKPGTINIDFKKDGKSVYTYRYEIKKREPGTDKIKGFDQSDVIYLITPDRFANGDSTNDVIPGMKENKVDRSGQGTRHGGDIRGIINRLDYIKDMGFTAIWPQPLVENDMSAYSYHGYAITNHYKVDPRFGTLEDYKELAEKSAAKGIKLIYDGVVNHSGTGYWWMNDLPFKDWINFPDSHLRTNHKRTVNQDRYASNYDKDLMTKGWFDNTMADMNGRNPFMANYLIQNSIWWIETLKLGGLRQDTYGYSDKDFLRNWSCRIMNEYPNFNMVGEEWSINPLITSYWQQGKKNADGYTSCLKTVMDFPLQTALLRSFKEQDDKYASKGFIMMYEALANDFNYADPNNLMVFGDNHDMDRLYTQLDKDLALTKMAFTFYMTTRGIPQVYYGTEILMDNTGFPGNHGVIRSDFPGGWSGDEKDAVSGKGLSEDQVEMQKYARQLLNWRKGNKVISSGKLLHFAPFDGVYVYFRYNADQTVMVVMNKNNKEMSIDTSRFDEIIKGKSIAINVISQGQMQLQHLTVPARSAIVFTIK